ncbi:LysR substrate-binding domain-containing protein [Phyllobacterium endophyticum]|uniref:LysR substrate-binding domain-containing protein n=1 Tax=Phyllobacterium endophyticum TaxID=1149773 RepID=UPI0011C98DF8|nr:LysR substrate-binding domain-containing protein [Phyllobacterium endophyticum]TXR49482.1 LysR family transcriptional regulator [Phyllobacterium endophyticum]
MHRRRKLPPLTALTAFEAAARLASFTKAADELGVTQAAVSRQIHLLEQQFGFPLFIRLHRKIELTEKGMTLSAAAGDAFDLIAGSVAEILRDGHKDELTISATVAFSHFWLLPRISEFSRQHPQINLRIVTQDKTPNIESGELDVAIRFGSGMWADGQAELLFEEEVFPVCSPDYAKGAAQIMTPDDLKGHPLIANDVDDPTWIGWTEWLAAFSVTAPRKTLGFRCSFYTEAIYAALNGQGIALGWRLLVEDLLAQNRLVRVSEAAVKTRNAYFVILPKRTRHPKAADLFLSWLKSKSDLPSMAN